MVETDDGEEISESESNDLEDGEILFEDRTYEEDEATFLQAYASAYSDVRRDLRDRRKERGFVRHGHQKSPSFRDGPPRRQGKGSGTPYAQRRGDRRFSKCGSRHNKADQKMIRGKVEDLAARTKCYNCLELGHFARDCPLKGGGKGNQKKVNFIVSRGSSYSPVVLMFFRPSPFPAQSSSNTSMRVFAGVKVKGFEAIVDTAAEDAVIGHHAMESLTVELSKFGLRPVEVQGNAQSPCAGIGGEAQAKGVWDVPTSVAGIQGVLRFTVLNDSEKFQTPPLLPQSGTWRR